MTGDTALQKTARTGLLAALTLGGVVASSWLPGVGGLLLAMAGIPGLLVMLGWGSAWFALYGLLAVSLTAGWAGWPSAVFLVPCLLAPAAVLAWTLRSGLEGFRALGVAAAFSTLISLAAWGVAPYLGAPGVELWLLKGQVIAQGKLVETRLFDLVKRGGADPAAITVIVEQFREWIGFIGALIPFTIVVFWHLLSLTVFHIGGTLFGASYGCRLPALPAFTAWRFDWRLIWVLIAGWTLYDGFGLFEGGELSWLTRLVGANCLAIGKTLYFVTGLSLLVWFFESRQVGGPGRVGLSVLALLFNQILVWLGVMDVWLDFRAPKEPRVQSRDSGDRESFFDQF